MTHRLKSRLAAVGAAIAAVVGAIALVSLAPSAWAGGTAQVQFVDPQNFSDAGRSPVDRERALKSLAEHLQRLAVRLPDGQTLRVEVLDVDLAGEQDPFLWNEVRILRGGADWPRITLRWALMQGERTLKSGEDRLSDASYLFFGAPFAMRESDLPFEKRMLDRWFAEQFGPAR